MKITKAIIPVASTGTRLRPWTNYLPKELIPVVDTPALEIVVREAVEAGIDTIVFLVSGIYLRLYRQVIRELKDIYHFEDIVSVQGPKRGTAYAISHIIPYLSHGEPFVAILADTLVESNTNCLSQMMSIYQNYNRSAILVERIRKDENIERFGVVACREEITSRICDIADVIEKPKREEAPSNLVVLGRYVLSYEIFEIIEGLRPNDRGEVCLTDALKALARGCRLLGYQLDGKSWDVGNRLDFLKTTVHYGLRHKEVGDEFREYLNEIALLR